MGARRQRRKVLLVGHTTRRAHSTPRCARDLCDLRNFVSSCGLMSFGANLPDAYRQAGGLRGQDPQWRQAERSTCPAADEIRAGDQPQDRKRASIAIPASILLRANEVIQ